MSGEFLGDDEVPPWHPYDGCYGCRRGNALAEKAAKSSGRRPMGADAGEKVVCEDGAGPSGR